MLWGHSIKPNEKQNPIDFWRKMGRGIPRGIGFGSSDACECFRYAPDNGSADILKNHKTRKLLFLRENGFRKNDVFMLLQRQTAKTKMTARTTRRYHVFIKIWLCDGICQSNPCFSWEPRFSFFCMANSFHGIHGIHRFHGIHGFHGTNGTHRIPGIWS